MKEKAPIMLSTLRRITLALAIAILAPAFAIAAEPPDLVLVNGKVVTVDDRFSIAQALAVKGGRIVAVGSTSSIRKLAGPGSDATAVTTSNPFYNLWFAVTGKMLNGQVVNRQTITREEALIAHTRSNAFIVFQESNLGSLQPGKYADLLVLDRDYLTVPADQIRNLKPMLTMVGGKIVYEAKADR